MLLDYWKYIVNEITLEEVIQVIDAYALIGDTAGLAEKIQSFFMQEVISETQTVLKAIVHEVCLYVFLAYIISCVICILQLFRKQEV